MINIQSCNITVMISDMDKAVNFYTAVLGLTLKNRYGNHWADIEGPGIAIGLHPTDRKIRRSDNLQIGFRVPDLNEAVSGLEKKGVQFSITRDGRVRLASFADPDGNTLYLVET